MCETFCANINEDVTTTKFRPEELEGIESDVLIGFAREGDDYVVSCKPSSVSVVMEGLVAIFLALRA